MRIYVQYWNNAGIQVWHEQHVAHRSCGCELHSATSGAQIRVAGCETKPKWNRWPVHARNRTVFYFEPVSAIFVTEVFRLGFVVDVRPTIVQSQRTSVGWGNLKVHLFCVQIHNTQLACDVRFYPSILVLFLVHINKRIWCRSARALWTRPFPIALWQTQWTQVSPWVFILRALLCCSKDANIISSEEIIEFLPLKTVQVSDCNLPQLCEWMKPLRGRAVFQKLDWMSRIWRDENRLPFGSEGASSEALTMVAKGLLTDADATYTFSVNFSWKLFYLSKLQIRESPQVHIEKLLSTLRFLRRVLPFLN